MGRIAPEKRVDLAIRIAEHCGVPLKIAAKVDKADQDYFKMAQDYLSVYRSLMTVAEPRLRLVVDEAPAAPAK